VIFKPAGFIGVQTVTDNRHWSGDRLANRSVDGQSLWGVSGDECGSVDPVLDAELRCAEHLGNPDKLGLEWREDRVASHGDWYPGQEEVTTSGQQQSINLSPPANPHRTRVVLQFFQQRFYL
jgi:hypothetical protein